MNKHKPTISTEPLWTSIRGVGRPPAHSYSHDDPTIHMTNPVNLWDSIDRIRDLEPGPSQHLPVNTPSCQRCGLPAEAEHFPHNRWWCHYCWEEVKSPMNPNAMVPKSLSTATTFEPSLSDPRGTEICHKCAVSFRPRIDNTGFTCPSCGETHRPPPAPRPSPTNGF